MNMAYGALTAKNSSLFIFILGGNDTEIKDGGKFTKTSQHLRFIRHVRSIVGTNNKVKFDFFFFLSQRLHLL